MISIQEQLPSEEECLAFYRTLLDTIQTETDYILLIHHFGYENKELTEFREKIRK